MMRTTINMTKTKRNNAVVSSFSFTDPNEKIMCIDASDRNWRTSGGNRNGVNDAFAFFRSRGYKYVLVDGEHVGIFDFRRSAGLF